MEKHFFYVQVGYVKNFSAPLILGLFNFLLISHNRQHALLARSIFSKLGWRIMIVG